jgi:2-(1,2-epoxy-1,2-dihydrophenyl)acetyl-CoA isomerase
VRTLDTGTDDLLASVDEGVAVLTMNRPARRNALSMEMLDGLARMLAAVEVDDEVGCVVLTGAGNAFCAGGDVRAMSEGSDGAAEVPFDAKVHRQRLSQRATSGKIWAMPKPVIAMIPGPAAGAGLALALSCDLRYASDSAVLTTAFAKVGFSGDYGGTWFLTQVVGTAKARELYYFSDRLSATEAEQLGLVNAVLPTDQLEADVLNRARRLAAGPRVAHRYMKDALNRAVQSDLLDCLDLEASFHNHTGRTEDHQEAARAFVEKRPPIFHGR